MVDITKDSSLSYVRTLKNSSASPVLNVFKPVIKPTLPYHSYHGYSAIGLQWALCSWS